MWFRRGNGTSESTFRISFRFIAGLNLARWIATLGRPGTHLDNIGSISGKWPVFDGAYHAEPPGVKRARSIKGTAAAEYSPDVVFLHSHIWDLPSVVNMPYRLEASRCGTHVGPEVATRLFASRLEWLLQAARCKLGAAGARLIWRTAAFTDGRVASNHAYTALYNNISIELARSTSDIDVFDFAGLVASFPSDLQQLRDEPFPVHQGEAVSEQAAHDLLEILRSGRALASRWLWPRGFAQLRGEEARKMRLAGLSKLRIGGG